MGTDEQLRDAQEQPDSELNSSNQSMDEGQNRDTETESTQVSATDTKVDNSIDPTTAEPALDTPKASKNSRKRTKTGCLTCRRRRIKCGEERPICNNCIKSKRNCEGYNHRSVLKEGGNNGQFGVPPEVSLDLHSPSYPFHHPSASYRPHGQSLYDVQMPPNATSLTPLAPRPPFTHNQIFPYEAHGLPQQPVYGIQQSRQSLDTSITRDMPSNLPDSGSHSHLYMQQAYGGQIDVAKAYDGLPGSGVPLPFMGNEGHHQYEASIAYGPSNVTSYEQNMTNFRQDSMTTFIPPMSSISDSQTAQLFRYFITVSAPILSAFERHTLEPSSMFSGKAVPEDQQGLWTYVMPRLALQSPPLLQAMLALASLQMARLEGDSILLSLKYYHVALRRVAKAVGQPSKRSGIDTLAATLLLGYYEVASAEHKKWNSHLLGARQLLMETDFLGKSKRIKKMKAQADARRRQDAFNGYSSGNFGSVEKYLGFEREIDENLVHDLAGFPPAYADNNDAILDSDFLEDDLTAKDIEDYDIRRDLLWWFLKQDAIQSMVSSNRLLLSFSRWSHCPPRAPMDRVDAPYGTFDHLVLLIGRITDFGAKDVARKRKAVEAGGGVWRPPPGMDLGQPRPPQGPTSGQSPDSQRPSPRAQQQWPNMPPPMKGMMPDPPPSKLPRGFSGDALSSPSSNQEDLDLEAATAEAEFEWSSIKVALKTFESRLGPDFGPLPAEETQTVVTPFGLARHYRSYAISVIWLWYYIAQIIHRRFHPSMPPAAMMAAGVAAKQTAQIANEIALTVGGLMPESDMDASSTLALGAALMDATLALFFAGVQFQDAAQRAWTISSLRAISQRMGWGSSDTIASGCERSWETAAQMGRGPPYIRTMDPWAKDDRVAGRPLNSAAPVTDDNDRRFIPVNAGARVHWAVGILGIEDEVGKLTV